MASLRDFARNIRRTAAGVPIRASRLQRAVALAVDQAVVTATPVDEGTARANWQVSIGGPASGVVETLGTSPQPAISRNSIAIQKSTPGKDIHLTNNLPYIVPLNEGHSKQAPAGFVETAVAAGKAAVRSSGIKLTEG